VPPVGHQQPEELRGPARAGGRAAQLAPARRGAEGADLGDEGGGHSLDVKGREEKVKQASIEKDDDK
jgi:hypothetical protein